MKGIRLETRMKYTDIYQGMTIVGRLFEDGSGGYLGTLFREGIDFAAPSEMRCLEIIKKHLGEM